MENGIDHGKLIDWVNEADDATIDSRNLSEKCRDYYDSKQWTDAEIRKLKKQKQAATVINRVKPKMDGLMGMERQNRTTAKAWPRTPNHEKGAVAATEGVRFCLQDNFYNQVRSACWDNLLIEGTGGPEVIVKPTKMGFKVVINQIPWDRIIYDPHSRRKDFSDARYKGQVVWMDYDQALELYPDGKDVLESMVAGSQTYDDKPRWMDSARKRVKIVELYYLQGGDWYYGCFTRGGFLQGPLKSPYMNEEGETEDPYCFSSLFVSREGDRYGAVTQLLDVQDEINKRRSKALHLMSVRQVRLERGAVEDINKTRDELAKPDGVVETTPGMEFEVLKTGDMAAAQFNLLSEAKLEIDSVSYNAAASGKDKQVQSGVALRAREVAGQTEVAPMFDVLKHMDILVYRKVWNRIKQYWRDEMWIRVTDDPNAVKWVGLNTEPGNQVMQLDVDIVMADAPDTVTQQIEDFQVLGEMVKSGFPMPPMAVIEASPLSNKERILKMMQEGVQVPEQVKEQMQAMQAEMQKLAEENQTLKADQQTEAAKIQMNAQAKQADLQLKAEMQAREIELERERAQAEIQLEREKAQAKIDLERAIAAAQIEVERERMALEKEKAAHQADIAERSAAAKEKQTAE
jgi:hypothetical protein